ncbi:hypothetical protein HKX48_000368 [Thoreauomyces humboldtii]|nr:hypothetical protein HKX48_000368 [Thoreauomyces humboldtii]
MEAIELPPLFIAPSAASPMQSVPLPTASHAMHVALFTEVQNAKEVRALIIKGDPLVPDMALINAATLVDLFQVQMACVKALLQQEQGNMRTRSLYSEVLFNLSPTTNISDAIRQFGVADASTALLAVMLGHDAPSSEVQQRLTSLIRGKVIPAGRIPEFTERKIINKVRERRVDQHGWPGAETVFVQIYKTGNAPDDPKQLSALVIGAMALKGHV